MAEEQSVQVPIQVTWEDLGSLPVMASNVFLVLQTPHEFILSFGFAAPPKFDKRPTLEEMKAATVIAKPIARLSMPPGRVVELLDLLRQQLDFYQKAQKQ